MTFSQDETEPRYEICDATGKRCYSRKLAGSVVNHCRKGNSKKRVRHHERPMRFYVCPHCGTYHLTHFRKARRKKR